MAVVPAVEGPALVFGDEAYLGLAAAQQQRRSLGSAGDRRSSRTAGLCVPCCQVRMQRTDLVLLGQDVARERHHRAAQSHVQFVELYLLRIAVSS